MKLYSALGATSVTSILSLSQNVNVMGVTLDELNTLPLNSNLTLQISSPAASSSSSTFSVELSTTDAVLLAKSSSSMLSTLSSDRPAVDSTTSAGRCYGTGTTIASDNNTYWYTLTTSVLTALPTLFEVPYVSANKTYFSPTLLPEMQSTTCLPCITERRNCGYGYASTDNVDMTYITPAMLASLQYVRCFESTITIPSLRPYPTEAFLDSRTCIELATITAYYDHTKNTVSYETKRDRYLQSFASCNTTVTYVGDFTTSGSCLSPITVGASNPLLDPARLKIRDQTKPISTMLAPTATPEAAHAADTVAADTTILAPAASPVSPADHVIATTIATTPTIASSSSLAAASDAAARAQAAVSQLSGAKVLFADAVQVLQALSAELTQVAGSATGTALSQVQSAEAAISSVLQQFGASSSTVTGSSSSTILSANSTSAVHMGSAAESLASIGKIFLAGIFIGLLTL